MKHLQTFISQPWTIQHSTSRKAISRQMQKLPCKFSSQISNIFLSQSKNVSLSCAAFLVRGSGIWDPNRGLQESSRNVDFLLPSSVFILNSMMTTIKCFRDYPSVFQKSSQYVSRGPRSTFPWVSVLRSWKYSQRSLRNEFSEMPPASLLDIRSVFVDYDRKGLQLTRNKASRGSSGWVTSVWNRRVSL